ncbi:MAG: DUF6796 family protein [Flavobacteriales bacterium]
MSPALLKLYNLLALLGVVVLCFGEFQYFAGYSGTNIDMSVAHIALSSPGHISCGMFCSFIGVSLMMFVLFPLRVSLYRTSFSMRQWLIASMLLYLSSILVFHVAMGFIGFNEQVAMNLDTLHANLALETRAKTQSLFRIITQVCIFMALVTSVLFSIAVLRKKTCMPWWSVFFTPIPLYILFKEIPSVCCTIAAPYGGWYLIASGCLGLFIFFFIIGRCACRHAATS